MRNLKFIVGPIWETQRRSTFIVSLYVSLTMRLLMWLFLIPLLWGHQTEACKFEILYFIHSSAQV